MAEAFIATAENGVLTITANRVGSQSAGNTFVISTTGTNQTAGQVVTSFVDGDTTVLIWSTPARDGTVGIAGSSITTNVTSGTTPGSTSTVTLISSDPTVPDTFITLQPGTEGVRGADRFSRVLTLGANETAPEVGSIQFNSNALSELFTRHGVSANFVAGDIADIQYNNSDGTTNAIRHGIHDGTGRAADDWQQFTLEIDGDLLVSDTVVADKLAANSVLTRHLTSDSIEAQHLQAGSVRAENIEVDGALTINDERGSLAWKKTGFNDFNTSGMFFGNIPGSELPRLLIGNGTQYIQFDDNGLQIVGVTVDTTAGTGIAVGEAIEYAEVGESSFQLFGTYTTILVELSGGGGGGGAADGRPNEIADQDGSAGGTSVVQVITDAGVVRGTYTAAGGGSGGSGDNPNRVVTNGQNFNATDTFGTASNLFLGYGGRTSQNATGISGGGGGGDNLGNTAGGGFAGSYTNVVLTNGASTNGFVSTDTILITVAPGGVGGLDESVGGYGGNGAARIEIST